MHLYVMPCFAEMVVRDKLEGGLLITASNASDLIAEVEHGTKLEACLADFGLSAVLPGPKEHTNSTLL